MIWFTADSHFGHEGILTHQLVRADQFSSIEVMDNNLIDGINSVVEQDDILYHLGDFCWQASRAGHYRQRLNVRELHTIRGNHDAASLRNHVSSLEHMKFLKIKHHDETIKIHLSHYPLLSWGSMHYGGLHLYGHCHGSMEEQLEEMFSRRLSMDVGVDNIFRLCGLWRPINFYEMLVHLTGERK